jgi:hypothetical protein
MDAKISAEIALKLCAEYCERLNERNLIDFYRSEAILFLIMKKEYFKSYMDNEEFWNFIDVLRNLTKNHTWQYEDEEDWSDAEESATQCMDYISQLDVIRKSSLNLKSDDSVCSNGYRETVC